MIDIKYRKIYENFICNYKSIHINPWHEISESELNEIYNKLINSMDINNQQNFCYFINYIIKRLSGKTDAHTKYYCLDMIPMNFRLFDNTIIVNYPENLRGSILKSINGISIKDLLPLIDDVITYGTKGKRKYEIEKFLFNRYALLGLPLFRNSNSLKYEIELINGEKIIKEYSIEDKFKTDELFDYNTYSYGDNNGTYKIENNNLIITISSLQKEYTDLILNTLNKIINIDLTDIRKVIIDLRGNIGGNYKAIKDALYNLLDKFNNKKIITITDYRVFSGGRWILKDLIEKGAVTIGEEISTSMSCYGNNKWINIDENWFLISEHYYEPYKNLYFKSKDEFNKYIENHELEEEIYIPDIFIEETIEDYLNRKDIFLEYALSIDDNILEQYYLDFK